MYSLLCDNCKEQIGKDYKYYHIEIEGPTTLSDDPISKDFCSKKCIAEFYTKATGGTE